ncbi:MAG: hypothetical protein VX210_09270 [Myxococcota bacterium]|nr:hypothetical protein [Myxococcota bacterium]
MALYRILGSALLMVALIGCGETDDTVVESDNGDSTGTPATEESLTFYRDVKPITDAHCVRCHDPEGVGYFDMTDPETVVVWAGAIKASTMNGTMPPYGAKPADDCTPEHNFIGDISLTDEQIETIAAWVDGGAELGEPSDDTSEPVYPVTTLDAFDFEGVPMTPIEVEDGDDSFICVVIDPNFTEETWINGVEVVADNIKLAHHMVLFTDPTRASLDKADENGTYPCFGSAGVPGSVLYAWAPGAAPLDLPADKATRVAPGTLFVMQMHYSPQGGAQSLIDETKLRFRFAPEPPKYEVYMQLMGNFDFNFSPALGIQPAANDPEDVKFEIPPDTTMHREVMRWTYTGRLPGSGSGGSFDGPNAREMRLWSIAPHMHYTGVDMKISIDRPEPGGTACDSGMLTSAIFCGLQAQCPQNSDFINCGIEACPEQFGAMTTACWGCAQKAFQSGGDLQTELTACETEVAPSDPAGRSANECLLSAPKYSFEWQWNYPFDADFDELPVFAPGHVLTLDCGYNNSMSNPLLAGALQRAGKSETQVVTLGDETLDEMCLTVMTLVFERAPGEDAP